MLRYGTSAPNERAEIVSLRVTVTGLMKKPPQEKITRGSAAPPKSAFTGKRPVSFDGKLPRRADLSARRTAGRQQDQRPGADRGARLDHGADAARPDDGRCVRQSGDQSRGSEVMAKKSKSPSKPQATTPQGRSGRRRDRAQRHHRRDRGNEDQPHAHRLQHDHLRGAGLHHRPVHAGGRDGLDRHRPADVHPRHGGDREGEDRALRHTRTSSRATSTSPTTPTSPAATSTISPSPCRSSTRASSSASPAAWRTGSTSAACSAA